VVAHTLTLCTSPTATYTVRSLQKMLSPFTILYSILVNQSEFPATVFPNGSHTHDRGDVTMACLNITPDRTSGDFCFEIPYHFLLCFYI